MDAFDRAIRTVAQVLLVLIGGDGAGLLTLNWTEAGYLSAGAFVASILTSVVSVAGPEGQITTVLKGNRTDGNPDTDAK